MYSQRKIGFHIEKASLPLDDIRKCSTTTWRSQVARFILENTWSQMVAKSSCLITRSFGSMLQRRSEVRHCQGVLQPNQFPSTDLCCSFFGMLTAWDLRGPEGFQRFTFQGTGKYPIQGLVSGTWVEFAFFQTYQHLVELPLWSMGEKARKKRTSLVVNALNELIVYIPISFLFDNQLISRHELGVNDWKPDYNL